MDQAHQGAGGNGARTTTPGAHGHSRGAALTTPARVRASSRPVEIPALEWSSLRQGRGPGRTARAVVSAPCGRSLATVATGRHASCEAGLGIRVASKNWATAPQAALNVILKIVSPVGAAARPGFQQGPRHRQ